MQYVAKINCALNIISIANVDRSENIAKHFHKYLYIRRFISSIYENILKNVIIQKNYSAFYNQNHYLFSLQRYP